MLFDDNGMDDDVRYQQNQITLQKHPTAILFITKEQRTALLRICVALFDWDVLASQKGYWNKLGVSIICTTNKSYYCLIHTKLDNNLELAVTRAEKTI